MNDNEVLFGDLFSTPWGWCAATYSPQGLVEFILPRKSRADAKAALSGRFGDVMQRHWPKLQKEVGEYFSGEREVFTIPLDPRSPSPFTSRVWRKAQAVPYGHTVTYGALASRSGRKSAARAVGQAMGRNPLPLFIPCHRIVAAAGIGGFADGLEMKTRLLALERKGRGKR